MCALSCVSLLAPCAEPSNPTLRTKLLELREQDQRYRQPGMDLNSPLLAQADASNRDALRKIIAEYGWPTSDVAGLDGSQAAFLIVQHSNQEPAFQQSMLSLLQGLAAQGRVPADQVAFLQDRLANRRYTVRRVAVTTQVDSCPARSKTLQTSTRSERRWVWDRWRNI